jgi:hypothetical protein
VIHNNAGVQVEKPLHESTVEDFDWVTGVNLPRRFLGCSELCGRARDGRQHHQHGVDPGPYRDPFLPIYTATKTSVLGMTRAIAVDWRRRRIIATASRPATYGDADGPEVLRRHPGSSCHAAEMEATYPGKRFAHPKEVAQAVLFPGGRGLVHQRDLILADGGLTARPTDHGWAADRSTRARSSALVSTTAITRPGQSRPADETPPVCEMADVPDRPGQEIVLPKISSRSITRTAEGGRRASGPAASRSMTFSIVAGYICVSDVSARDDADGRRPMDPGQVVRHVLPRRAEGWSRRRDR